MANELFVNLDNLHTTELGAARIRRNLGLGDINVVAWCKEQIKNPDSITRTGKNWYVRGDGFVISVPKLMIGIGGLEYIAVRANRRVMV